MQPLVAGEGALNQRGLSRRHAFDDAKIQIYNLLTIYGAGDGLFSGDGFFFRFFFFS